MKLIVTDMDGTFLRSDGDFNRELFREVRDVMQRKGIQFAPCTGKQCERVEELFGSDAHDMWILGDSATRIKHAGEVVYESFLDHKLAIDIIEKIEAIPRDLIVILSTPLGAIVKRDLRLEQFDIVRSSFSDIILVDELRDVQADILKITVHDATLQSAETKKALARYEDQVYLVASEPAWLDVASSDTDKGTSVARLQVMLGIGPAETMVFGDGLNDLELMRMGIYSFAMRNGCDETIAAANYVTRTNDEDAVMMTILQMLAIDSR